MIDINTHYCVLFIQTPTPTQPDHTMKNDTYTYEQACEMMNKRNEQKAQPKKRTFFDWAQDNEPALVWGCVLVYAAVWFFLLSA